jgi:hypothetical protein
VNEHRLTNNALSRWAGRKYNFLGARRSHHGI